MKPGYSVRSKTTIEFEVCVVSCFDFAVVHPFLSPSNIDACFEGVLLEEDLIIHR